MLQWSKLNTQPFYIAGEKRRMKKEFKDRIKMDELINKNVKKPVLKKFIRSMLLDNASINPYTKRVS